MLLMQDSIALILDESLEAIEKGILTRTQCLERHPEHKGELAVLIDAALILRSTKLPTPNQAYFKAGRARLVAKIEQEQQLTVGDRLGHFFNSISTHAVQLRPVFIALLLAFLFVMFSGGTVYASAHALPGDTLYPLKTSFEDLRLTVARDEDESALYEQFAQLRVEEIQDLIDAGREGDLAIAVSRLEENLVGFSLLLENSKPDEEAWAEQKAIHLEEQLSKHIEVLNALLAKVPQSFKPGKQRAIFVNEVNLERLLQRWASKEPVGPPAETGKPVGSEETPGLPGGQSGGFGQPADTGKPDDVGKPDKEEKIKEDKVKEDKIKEDKIKEEKDKETETSEVEEEKEEKED
jgi:hypothetical protein